MYPALIDSGHCSEIYIVLFWLANKINIEILYICTFNTLLHVAIFRNTFRYIQLEQKLILTLWDQGLFQIPKLTMYVFGCLRHRFGFGPDLSIFSFNSIYLVKKLTKSNQSDPNIFLISPKDIFVVKTILSDLGSKIQIFDRRNQWYK